MTYGRDDGRRGSIDPRSRSFEEDRYGREDRGFFERARDEVSSWFGDEDSERRRDRDERMGEGYGRSDRHSIGDRDYNRAPSRSRDDDYRRPYTGRSNSEYGASRQSFGDDFGPGRAYQNDRFDRGQTQGFSGSQASGQREFTGSASGLHDRDYSTWRNRQIDELDRDYDDFRRENSARFESEFTNWRSGRQAKKGLIQQLNEHMDVVGSDGESVGKIDHIKADKVILTKNDSPDGRHHVVSCSRFDRVEEGKLFLDKSASEIQADFNQQANSRALFEPERDDDNGPHVLNRSFSGTY